ncbi:MAG TPA: 2,3-bisphosphoglycerate-independent phosphoglycerate mutase [Firmicutes bacterium]|nr:2,3-bisphosphoglycerate-independent phosphoglycerate mutase [Candidatus Fermentithermobacillaceae bacterium]
MKDRPVALIILDGWGIPCEPRCAVTDAGTPRFERLWREYPHTTLDASAEAVGLMPGQMGDSNVGHLNIGAGRIVYQDVMRISRDIENGSFFRNPALLGAMAHARERSSALHLMGLVSDGGVHSLETHLFALLKMAKENGVGKTYVHAFLDGRDVPPRSAAMYLKLLEDKMDELSTGAIASITGRYWAMDRDKRWDRVERAYRLLTKGEGLRAGDWRSALEEAYARDESDEFVQPTAIHIAGSPATVRDGDALIFFNFRADRARELTYTFLDEEFKWFDRGPKPDVHYCGMMRYEEGLEAPFAYLPLTLDNTLGEVVSKAGLRQLRIAETEKYAHVTFFLNGKKDDPFPGEERVLIPSPKEVATYDKKPEMSAPEVTAAALDRIEKGDFDFIVLNYANPDMVGHTGVYEAAVAALETVDRCLGELVDGILAKGGSALVVADHGNVEDLVPREDGHDGGAQEASSHTYHSMNPVPCILVGERYRGARLRPGVLADVAPTVLSMLGIPKPGEMDRDSLIIT